MEKTISDYVLQVLSEIIQKNMSNKKCDFKERIYKFNKLDLMLSNGIDVESLIDLAKYHKDAFINTSRFSNFDAILL